jgi:hypothetical protein
MRRTLLTTVAAGALALGTAFAAAQSSSGGSSGGAASSSSSTGQSAQSPSTAAPAGQATGAQNAQGTNQNSGTGQGQNGQANSRQSGAGTGAAASSSITTEQRTQIRQTVTRIDNAPRVSSVNFKLSVGIAVPTTVRLAPVPTTIVEIHPAWRGYMFFIVGDDIVIVEPGSHKIVAARTRRPLFLHR